MQSKSKLTFWEMWNLSFGFFGVQIAYALQSANHRRVFATLGAEPHQLSFFWILPPLMGMIVQPLIGKWSDRTWCRMGRRKPYLLIGALISVLVMIFLPNAGSLSFSSRLILGLNGAGKTLISDIRLSALYLSVIIVFILQQGQDHHQSCAGQLVIA